MRLISTTYEGIRRFVPFAVHPQDEWDGAITHSAHHWLVSQIEQTVAGLAVWSVFGVKIVVVTWWQAASTVSELVFSVQSADGP